MQDEDNFVSNKKTIFAALQKQNQHHDLDHQKKKPCFVECITKIDYNLEGTTLKDGWFI